MRKRLLLLLAVLPLSASAQTFQITLPSPFNFFDILDRLNSEASELPDFGQTYGPLTLNHLGEFSCPQCGAALSETEQINAAKFASNMIFGKNRVVNIKDLGYINLTPYIEGVKGLRIKLENDKVIEMRVDKAAVARLSQIASENGAVLVFRIVYDDNTTDTIELNVKFNEDQIFLELKDDEKNQNSNTNSPSPSASGGGGIAGGFFLPNDFQIPTWGFDGNGGSNWIPIVTSEELRPCQSNPGDGSTCD